MQGMSAEQRLHLDAVLQKTTGSKSRVGDVTKVVLTPADYRISSMLKPLRIESLGVTSISFMTKRYTAHHVTPRTFG